MKNPSIFEELIICLIFLPLSIKVQVWREEMRALRREDIGNFKSVLDNSTSEATGEMKKTTQVILNSVKTNVKNSINDEVCEFDYNYKMVLAKLPCLEPVVAICLLG